MIDFGFHLSGAQWIISSFSPLALFSYIAKINSFNLVAKGLRPTNVDEIRAWLGIRIGMGLSIVSDMDEYWSTRSGFKNDLISQTMTKNWFSEINTCLACSNPNRDPKDMPSEEKQQLSIPSMIHHEVRVAVHPFVVAAERCAAVIETSFWGPSPC